MSPVAAPADRRFRRAHVKPARKRSRSRTVVRPLVRYGLVVIVLGYTCVRLSQWQFHRYAERKDANSVIRTNLAAGPVPVDSLLSPRTYSSTFSIAASCTDACRTP